MNARFRAPSRGSVQCRADSPPGTCWWGWLPARYVITCIIWLPVRYVIACIIWLPDYLQGVWLCAISDYLQGMWLHALSDYLQGIWLRALMDYLQGMWLPATDVITSIFYYTQGTWCKACNYLITCKIRVYLHYIIACITWLPARYVINCITCKVCEPFLYHVHTLREIFYPTNQRHVSFNHFCATTPDAVITEYCIPCDLTWKWTETFQLKILAAIMHFINRNIIYCEVWIHNK